MNNITKIIKKIGMKCTFVFSRILSNISEAPPKIEYIPLISIQYQLAINRYNFASTFCTNKTVLDIGCGYGYGCERLAKKGARKVVGIDTNEKYIQHATRSIINKENNKNITFIHIKESILPFENNTFDTILFFEVIEHIKPKEVNNVIDDIYRVLKKRGQLIVSSPNKKVVEGMIGKNNKLSIHHTKEYTTKELKAIIQRRFTDVKIYKQTPFKKDTKIDANFLRSIFFNPGKIIPDKEDYGGFINIIVCTKK